jgi:membrane-bound lytic murein transglycosylase D
LTIVARAAYHRPVPHAAAAESSRPRIGITELRLPRRLILVLPLVLAACAAPVTREGSPEPSASANSASPVDAPNDSPETSVAAPVPAITPPPFSSVTEAELEPLPPSSPDLWARIVAGYGIPDIEGPLVEKWEQWYSERPDYVARMVDRSRRYLYHIVSEVQARRMPLDIALLPMVESAFNPVALSTSRASGIWQFMPSTGKHYGLDQNFWFDSRRDVVAATDKALDYLERLYGMFGDWQLALAAYNWGEGNVQKAIARNKSRGLPTDYASLDMPAETRNYLPKLQAVKNIVRDPERYNLVLADVPDAPYFAVVRTSRRMDVKVAADLAEMPVEEFKALNPQHNRPVIAGADEHTILLPIDRAEVFAAKLDLHEQPLVSWQAYRVRQNETLPMIASKFGMDVDTLRTINGLGSRPRLHAGHVLLVPAERGSKDASESLARAVFTTVPQGRTFYYRVNRGDTLPGIAARYSVTVDELRQWNGLTHATQTLRVGQQLRVTSDVVPVKTKGAAKRTATGGAKAVKPVAKSRAGASHGKAKSIR